MPGSQVNKMKGHHSIEMSAIDRPKKGEKNYSAYKSVELIGINYSIKP